jgi:hypothetical protein
MLGKDTGIGYYVSLHDRMRYHSDSQPSASARTEVISFESLVSHPSRVIGLPD